MAVRSVTVAAVLIAVLPVSRAGTAQEDRVTERMVVLRPDGTVLATLRGAASHTVIAPELDRELLTPGARLRISHTHPAGTSLSAADLGQLAKPGVLSIEAIGNDGSRYLAEPVSGRDAACIEDRTHPAALAAVLRHLRAFAPRDQWREFDAHVNHLAAIALHKAGVISYHAQLSPSRRESYTRHRVIFGRATESAAAAAQRVAHAGCAGA